MILKKWKKVAKYEWVQDTDMGFEHNSIYIKWDKIHKCYVVIYGINVLYRKEFKTKQQALKFAKAYMRKH